MMQFQGQQQCTLHKLKCLVGQVLPVISLVRGYSVMTLSYIRAIFIENLLFIVLFYSPVVSTKETID